MLYCFSQQISRMIYHPSNPVNPNNPNNPNNPVIPCIPNNPNNPVIPNNPNNPGIPANPSNPAHSSNPGILSNPGNPDIQGIPSNLLSSSLVSFDIKCSLVVSMPHMPFIASPAPIHRHALCFELRVLIEIFPSIVLSLVGLLSLPGVLLASVVLRVRLKRRHFVEVFMSFVTHVLFCVVLRFLL